VVALDLVGHWCEHDLVDVLGERPAGLLVEE
jgi:hypothetical protein